MLKLSYWKENWARNFSWILGCLVLFFIVLRSYFSWQWADDFCNFNTLHNQNPWQFAWHLYNYWDGRGLMQGVFLGFSIKYFPVTITNIIWAIALIGSSYLIYKILIIELPCLNKKKQYSLIQIAAISVALWLGMNAHIAETVYWATGGYYIFSVFLGLLWVYFLTKLTRSDREFSFSHLRIVMMFIFSVLAGMLSFNLSTGLIAINSVILVICWLSYGPKSIKYKIGVAALSGILIGTIIISVAPGNFVRSLAGPRSFQLDFGTLLNNYISTLKYYFGLSEYLIIFSVLVALLMALLMRNKFKFREKIVIDLSKIIIYIDKKLLINVLERSKYFLAALATILPLVFLPDFLAPRTSIFFMVFISVFLLSSFIIIFKNLFYVSDNGENYENRSPLKFANLFFCLLFLLQLSVIIPHTIQAHKIEKKINERDKFISKAQNMGKDITADSLNLADVPFSVRLNDISTDPEHWINGCVAKFYSLKSIRINESK